eukprot:TRINITY_DN15158_c0_g1_i1.p2 TRINITY_DN15158_c0_g1~~TRINITY_DN15158_c0_g1_i1.p2  ORF type:complete len:146 (-),score=45.62 TRINITY_DN15158_c0_g1_i1:48-485(-)
MSSDDDFVPLKLDDTACGLEEFGTSDANGGVSAGDTVNAKEDLNLDSACGFEGFDFGPEELGISVSDTVNEKEDLHLDDTACGFMDLSMEDTGFSAKDTVNAKEDIVFDDTACGFMEFGGPDDHGKKKKKGLLSGLMSKSKKKGK